MCTREEFWYARRHGSPFRQLEYDSVLITALDDLDGTDELVRAMGLPEHKVSRLS